MCLHIWSGKVRVKCAHSCIFKGIKVCGFIDNCNNLQGGNVEGINVYSFDYYLDNNKSETIIIATLNFWSEFEEQLEAYGLNRYIHYNILHIWDPDSFPTAGECFDEIVEDSYLNENKYQELRCVLADERSRVILDELLKFRLTIEIKHTRKAYSLSMERGTQYFDHDIISFGKQEIFVDGGAYIGETSKEFITQLSKQGKEHQQIYIFEPDTNLIKQAENSWQYMKK